VDARYFPVARRRHAARTASARFLLKKSIFNLRVDAMERLFGPVGSFLIGARALRSGLRRRAADAKLLGHIQRASAVFSAKTLPMIRDDHRTPLAHYGAIKGALARGCSAESHHQQGRDRFKS
jgi:hypothetical protein